MLLGKPACAGTSKRAVLYVAHAVRCSDVNAAQRSALPAIGSTTVLSKSSRLDRSVTAKAVAISAAVGAT